MKSIAQYFIGFTLIIFSISCTDLEEDLRGEIVEDTFVNDDYIPICYDYRVTASAILRNSGTANHGGYYTLQEVTSDEMVVSVKGSDWSNDEDLIALHQQTYTPSNTYIRNAWLQMYFNIGDINSWMRYTNQQDNVAVMKGVRAYLYWRLLDLFGRVKIITEDAPNPPQATEEEVFYFIEQQLLEALDIPEVSPSMDLSNSPLPEGGDAYELSTYGALGILAKLYLNAEVYIGVPMYDKAEIIATYIIDSGKYQLCGPDCSVDNWGRRIGVDSDPHRLEGYAAIFAPNNEGNPEHIFSVMYDQASGYGMNFSQMNLHPGSQLSWQLAEQPWNGYATLEEFYNSYEEADARREASFLVGPQLDFTGSAILDYISDDDNVQLTYTPEINQLTGASREAGVRAKKFSFQLNGQRDMNNDYPIVRLGEMYLIRAEAKARLTGNWTAAEPDVNILRARAKVAPYEGTLTEEEFLAERGREMFQEAARRTDLIRFGRYSNTWWEKPASPAFKEIFPIPQSQLIADPGLTQNPGY